MNTEIFVVSQKNWDNFEPDYMYPYFYYTKISAIENAKARAVKDNEPDWTENYRIETLTLAEDKEETADEWNNRNRIS